MEPSSPIVEIKDHSDHSMKLKLVSDHVFRTNETPSEFPRYSPTFPSTSKPWRPAKSLDRRQHVEDQPASLLPSPSLISNTSQNRSNPLAKRRTSNDMSSRFTQAKSHPKRDAYQYSTEDPDEEWTTLPSRKKGKLKFFPIFVAFPACINIVLATRCLGILLTPNGFMYQACAYHRR